VYEARDILGGKVSAWQDEDGGQCHDECVLQDTGCSSMELNAKNFDEATKDKMVFIKFLAPW